MTATNKQWLFVVLAVFVLFVLESIAVHQIYASRFLGGNDFYPRWAGARALLLEGRDPYDPEVTREIESVLDPLGRQTNSFSFAYPLHVIFLLLPLAYLPYPWAYALWMVTIKWAALLLIVALLGLKRWRPSPLAAAGFLLGILLFYPVTRSIILGQFTVHVTLFVGLSLLALSRGWDGWAGIFLAATSIKPQMVIFLAPWLLIWAIRKRRWRFHASFFTAGAVYFLAALLLFPRWPISFLEDIPRYSSRAGGRSPLAILSDLFFPGTVSTAWLQILAGTLVIAGMALAIWRVWKHKSDVGAPYFQRALAWTIVAGLLVPFQTGSTNQVLLTIPFFLWLAAAIERWGRWPAILLTAVVLGGEWIIFVTTFSGENRLMFLTLPLLALFALLAQEIARSSADVRDAQTAHWSEA